VAPRSYTLIVEGELGPKYASAFPGMRLESGNGQTRITGRVEDQAQLHGILDAVAAYNLALVSVTPNEARDRKGKRQ
jgi:hypothetical protein